MKEWNFFFKHWGYTLLLSPLLFGFAVFIIEKGDIAGAFSYISEVFPILVLVGFIYSVPTYMVAAVVFYFLRQKNIQASRAKLIFVGLIVLGILISFYWTFRDLTFEWIPALLLYSGFTLGAILAGFIVKWPGDEVIGEEYS